MKSFEGYMVLAVILTELTTDIVTSSAVFERLRAWLRRDPPPGADGQPVSNPKPTLIGVLFSCGYCFSVWSGIFWSILFGLRGKLDFLPGPIENLIWGLIVHRASNAWHALAADGRKMAQAVYTRIAGAGGA